MKINPNLSSFTLVEDSSSYCVNTDTTTTTNTTTTTATIISTTGTLADTIIALPKEASAVGPRLSGRRYNSPRSPNDLSSFISP